jgi:hypothetical protein
MIDPRPPDSALIRELELKWVRAAPADLADLALLRRNLAHLPDHPDPRAVAIVVGYCGRPSASQDAALLTACLWATRHRNTLPLPGGWNLGRALRSASYSRHERVWQQLCTATPANLPRVMSAVLEVLARNDTALDWHRLHRDLHSWYQGSNSLVLRRWCTGLFSPANEHISRASLAPPTPSISEE